MHFKSGVVMWDMEPCLVCKFPVIDRVSREMIGRDGLITSARDGVHSENSLHYLGRAVDLRTRDIPDAMTRHRYRDRLAAELGDDFDVVLEPTHVHVEFDPDEPTNPNSP